MNMLMYIYILYTYYIYNIYIHIVEYIYTYTLKYTTCTFCLYAFQKKPQSRYVNRFQDTFLEVTDVGGASATQILEMALFS